MALFIRLLSCWLALLCNCFTGDALTRSQTTELPAEPQEAFVHRWSSQGTVRAHVGSGGEVHGPFISELTQLADLETLSNDVHLLQPAQTGHQADFSASAKVMRTNTWSNLTCQFRAQPWQYVQETVFGVRAQYWAVLVFFLIGVPFAMQSVSSALSTILCNSPSAQMAHNSQTQLSYLQLWAGVCCLAFVIGSSAERLGAGFQTWVRQVVAVVFGTSLGIRNDTGVQQLTWFIRVLSWGVLLNWMGTEVAHVEWWPDPGRLLVSQMHVMVDLAAAAALCSIINQQIYASQDDVLYSALRVGIACKLMIAVKLLLVFLADPSLASVQMHQLLCSGMETCMLVWFISMGLYSLSTPPLDQHVPVLGWLSLVWIYGTRLLHDEPNNASEMDVINLYIWAFFVQQFPLPGQLLVGSAIINAWPVWVYLSVGTLISSYSDLVHLLPGAVKVFMALVAEIVAAVAFATVPSSKQSIALPRAIRKHLPWFTHWALTAFCTYKAIFYIIGEGLFGHLLLLSLAALSYHWVGHQCVSHDDTAAPETFQDYGS